MLFAGSSPFAHSRVEHLNSAGFPIVSIILDDGREFEEWAEFRDAHTLGMGTQRPTALAIGTFLDFIAARGEQYRDQPQRHRLFQGFADVLVMGTIQDGDDPSGLFWLPRTQDVAHRMVAAVTKFADWLEVTSGIASMNPTRAATFAEQILYFRAWRRKTDASLIQDTKSKARIFAATGAIGRVVAVHGRKPGQPNGSTKRFPEEMFDDLLRFGFRRRHELLWTTYRDQAIALLLHEGGTRVSEPMHMWLDDVFLHPDDSTEGVVRIYHPTEGLREYEDPMTGRPRDISRAEYLRLCYNRLALTQLTGKKMVGWKEPMLCDSREKYFHVFWRSPASARAFLVFYTKYVASRPRVTRHPYLWVTNEGNPMTVRAYERVHAAAMRRIGLDPYKSFGTTPHGHRHSYGHYLRESKLDRKVIQRALHHRSVLSQEVYTEADMYEVNAAMLASDRTLENETRFEWVQDERNLLANG
jgi:site-specific recombinase XerD